MAKRTLNGLRMIIVGADAIPGQEIAREAIRKGAQVLAVVPGSPSVIDAVRADVTTPAGRQQVIDTALDRFRGIDMLVLAHVATSSLEMRPLFEANYFSICELIRLAIPHLKIGVTPAIVNVFADQARQGVAGAGFACASQFALRGFCEALAPELCKLAIDVIQVPWTGDSAALLSDFDRMRILSVV